MWDEQAPHHTTKVMKAPHIANGHGGMIGGPPKSHAPLAEAPTSQDLCRFCLSAGFKVGIACSARLVMLMIGWVVNPHGHLHKAHVEGPPKSGTPMELSGSFAQGKGLKAWLSRAFRVLAHALHGFCWTNHPENHFGGMFDIPQSHSQNLGSIWKGPDLVLASLKSRTIFVQIECGQKLGDGVS